ncbi:type II/IV secretion system protein [Burkholderia lata]|uniref:Type II/IV secretion system protein n=1 Tax=Burkholderia lata (strain ATCC 17760 / DSM 23089 / LMG 22485 / NCIMB 9086 / R18194 / 383) TaxID=482957 RepID=A0A6P2V4V7_BURL3|nr:ATPase, T2SS/T4P/T4SS family [Burkholderia lata]VWC83166.1 type II/IV secretion system protein [Burkholderia lata]
MDVRANGVGATRQIIPPPEKLGGQIAFDRMTMTVWSDKPTARNPVFLSWIDRNKDAGFSLKLQTVDLSAVMQLRDGQGYRFNNRDVDQPQQEGYENRAEALELIERAAYYRASDIHFLLRGQHAIVQLTVNNDLRHFREYQQEKAELLVRAIWQGLVTTGDAQWRDHERQNAQVTGEKLKTDTGVTSIRIVRGPMYPAAQGGQFMVLRLQYANTVRAERRAGLEVLRFPTAPRGEFLLPKMGFTEQNIEKLRHIMSMPDGILIITGPTGAGKSTTDYELRKEEARVRPYLKQIMIADPIEFPEEFSTQIPVTNALDKAATAEQFAEAMAAALRMAPRMISPGEIRGAEVALMAFEAATTGHKVSTTLHVSDAFLWPDRLELMDITKLKRRMFCDPKIVRGVVAQRLLSPLCPHCKVHIDDAPGAVRASVLAALRTWSEDGDLSEVYVRGTGCEECSQEGTGPRFGIMEVVVTDARLMADFIDRGTAIARRNYHCRPDADPPLLETAIGHVLSGRVDPNHVQEMVDVIVTKKQFHEVVDVTAGDANRRSLEIVNG